MIGRPTLVVVSGRPGAGKTTLAHALAEAIGCPAICRDEIKDGMVHAVAGSTDEIAMRALHTFFGVLELLLRAGVTTVAEAAFQDRLWRPGLTPLLAVARLRVVHCVVTPDIARARRPHVVYGTFDRVSVDAPSIEVDTTNGYKPDLGALVAFVNR